MISRIAQTALVLSGIGVMLALPAQAQQVVMTPEGTSFLMVPFDVPALIVDVTLTPLPELREFPIVPGSDRANRDIPAIPATIVADPGSVRIGGENGVVLRDAKLTDTPEKPLRRLTEAEEREGVFTTSAPISRSQFTPINTRISTTPLIPNPNLRMINVSDNGSPLSASRIFPLPIK